MSLSSGTGVTFPLTFDSFGDSPPITGNKLIIASLTQLFSTEQGEHPVDKDYGHSLSQLLFLNFDDVTVQTMARQLIVELIAAYEDRVRVDAVLFSQGAERSTLKILVKFTNVIDSSSGEVATEIGGTSV